MTTAQMVSGNALPMTPREVAFWRAAIIGVIGFLTLVDLFATQAVLPSLA